MEVETQLKLINKPSVKSIQRKPSFEQRKSRRTGAYAPKIGLEKDLCPLNTVPIRRTTKQDLIRAKALSNSVRPNTQTSPGSHYAVFYMKKFDNISYTGVKGRINAYNPRVEKDQMSDANTWVQNGPDQSLNTIVTGWMVYPTIYGGDDRSHFFSAWTDAETKNWWLLAGDNNSSIGYFPAALFSNLTSADRVGWGGRVINPGNDTSPPMGSGYFPDADATHCASFSQMLYQTTLSKEFVGPSDKSRTETYADNTDCYNVEYYGYQGADMGYTILFGGPGGNCGS
ncbi:Protein of Unknown Function (DUF239) [Quillaja saponaria]|uniref:Neprosin PEP catalytic domain-containing protein n=1 Tax=Quillaja saponaria TaxID=32244 RepID=A0AAD7QCM4_QUISA|nr:Protein of Unknown Function (DUF239) [Quillaja saponaria]